jgi:uncharacterized protein YidB (DUF937 family)
MDDLGNLSSMLGGQDGGAGAAGGLANAIQAEGGLDGLLGKLRAAGLGDQVDSWTGTGANQAVTPQQLGSALGQDEVQHLAAKSGLDVTALLPLLAAFLPQIVDMLTPDGRTPPGGLDSATGSGGVPDLGGLLGGLLGGTAAAGGASGGGGLDDLIGGLGGMLGGDKGR